MFRLPRSIGAMRLTATVLTTAVLATACSSARAGSGATSTSPSHAANPAASATPVGEASPSSSPVDPIVGEWARSLQCPELLAAFNDAGLQAYVPDMVWSSFFWPQPENFDDFVFHAKDPCKDAQPRLHSHFFTAEGEFGSKDDRGQEVDYGTYEIVDKHLLRINDVLFHYRIRGDAITFDPVTPDCTPCFGHAWAIAVASPGGEWDRIA